MVKISFFQFSVNICDGDNLSNVQHYDAKDFVVVVVYVTNQSVAKLFVVYACAVSNACIDI